MSAALRQFITIFICENTFPSADSENSFSLKTLEFDVIKIAVFYSVCLSLYFILHHGINEFSLSFFTKLKMLFYVSLLPTFFITRVALIQEC